MKKLLLLILCMIFLIGNISSTTFDDVKYHDEETKTYTLKNWGGLGKEIAQLELKTPQMFEVPRGYQKVAEIEIRNGEYDYKEIIKGIELYNIKKDMKEIIRNIDHKYRTIIQVPEYKTICDKGFSANGTIIDINCRQEQVGLKDEIVWKDFTENSLLKGEIITLGLFTDVQKGDKIEWIISVYGNERLTKWAVWTESLDVDLISYYKLNETSGIIVDELGLSNGTNHGATRGVAGKIGNAFDFERDNSEWVDTINNIGITGAEPRTISLWINIESLGTMQTCIFFGTALTNRLNILGVSDTNKFIFNGYDNDLHGSSVLSAETWYHVVMTYNGTYMKLYVNGSEETISFGTPDKTLITGASPMQFGLYNLTGGLAYFDGIIDEVGLWNRSLSDAEVSDLWNGGAGLSYGFISIINVELISPENNTQPNVDPLTFTAQLTPDTHNLTNATIYIWYDNETLWKTQDNTTISGNESLNVTFGISDWEIGNYIWNVYGVQGNGNGTNSSFADDNFTLEWIPFEVSAELHNNYSYETKNETFYINITTDQTVSDVGAFLVYNSNFYAAEHSCSGGLCQIEREIDIPLVNPSLDSENKTFHWQITLFGDFGTFTTNTTTRQQNVSSINFVECGTLPIAVNFTTHKESDRSALNTNFNAYFQYYLGTGSVYKEGNSSQSGASVYDFCINQNETFYVISIIDLSASNYEDRHYYLSKKIYTNITTIQPLYLLNSTVSSNIIIEVKDQGLIPKKNILVNISRFYPGIGQFIMVESQVTDEFGQILTKLIENNAKYKFAFYDLNNNLLKTSDSITIACHSSICIIPFIIEEIIDEFERFEDLITYSYTFSFDNTTNIFTFSWDDQREESATVRLEVIRYLLNGSSVVCNTSSTSILATLNCNVGGARASYKAQIFRTVDGETRRIAFLNIKVVDPASTYGIEGLLWVFVLLFTCIGIGAFNPSVGASLYGVGFIIMGTLGIISMPIPVFFANTLLVIIFVWAVSK